MAISLRHLSNKERTYLGFLGRVYSEAPAFSEDELHLCAAFSAACKRLSVALSEEEVVATLDLLNAKAKGR